jgi:hypothetical protein
VDHICIQVAAVSGIDLYYRHTRAVYAFGVVHGLLIPLNHCQFSAVFQSFNASFQEACLSRTRRTHQVDGNNPPGFEITAVPAGQQIIFAKDIFLYPNQALVAVIVGMTVWVIVIVRVIVIVVVIMAVWMIMGMIVIVEMFFFAGQGNSYRISSLTASAGIAHNLFFLFYKQ